MICYNTSQVKGGNFVKKRRVKNLNDEIFKTQIDDFYNEFQKMMSKKYKNALKRVLIRLGVVVGALVGLFVFKNPFVVGAFFLCGLTEEIIYQVKGIKKETQIDKPKNEKDLFEFLDEVEQSPIKYHNSDFYTPEYQEILEEHKNEAQLEVVGQPIIEKEDVIAQVVYEIEQYTRAYKLPKIDLSAKNWDKLFDILYGLYVSGELTTKYYEALSYLIRYVFSQALVFNKPEVTIDDFINNLPILTDYGLTIKDIKYMQDEFKTDLKVVDFNSLVRKNSFSKKD